MQLHDLNGARNRIVIVGVPKDVLTLGVIAKRFGESQGRSPRQQRRRAASHCLLGQHVEFDDLIARRNLYRRRKVIGIDTSRPADFESAAKQTGSRVLSQHHMMRGIAIFVVVEEIDPMEPGVGMGSYAMSAVRNHDCGFARFKG